MPVDPVAADWTWTEQFSLMFRDMRMGEHEVVVTTPQRLLVQQVELAGEPVGQGHASR